MGWLKENGINVGEFYRGLVHEKIRYTDAVFDLGIGKASLNVEEAARVMKRRLDLMRTKITAASEGMPSKEVKSSTSRESPAPTESRVPSKRKMERILGQSLTVAQYHFSIMEMPVMEEGRIEQRAEVAVSRLDMPLNLKEYLTVKVIRRVNRMGALSRPPKIDQRIVDAVSREMRVSGYDGTEVADMLHRAGFRPAQGPEST